MKDKGRLASELETQLSGLLRDALGKDFRYATITSKTGASVSSTSSNSDNEIPSDGAAVQTQNASTKQINSQEKVESPPEKSEGPSKGSDLSSKLRGQKTSTGTQLNLTEE